MPIFQLDERILFPPPHLADEEGLLAVGGDLSPERLLAAYQMGIFPWYGEEDPILWWSPDPRLVLYPERLKVSKSMRQVLRKKEFSITFDQAFRQVVAACQQQPRPGQPDTWITPEMLDAYATLHEMGFAHSVEVWQGQELAGGLYGLCLGKCFFGESMFSRVSNASKAGFITLVQLLEQKGFTMIDCQVTTDHLLSLGAEEIPRSQFIAELAQSIAHPTLKGNWQHFTNS